MLRDEGSYIFSTHSLERIAERGLSMEAVRRALEKGRWFPISKAACRCVLGGMQVILARDAPIVITCYQT